MAVTAAQIARLRRMVAEPTATTYSDDDLGAIIESHPVPDSEGYWPTDDDWTATYDLNAAAAEVWEEKAAALADAYDFQADGASFQRNQLYANAQQQARRYNARRMIVSVQPVLAASRQPDDMGDEDDD